MPPDTESVHFGCPFAISIAVTSPEGKDTTSMLPAIAGLTLERSEAPSGRPREVHSWLPSWALSAKSWLSEFTTNTLPFEAVGEVRMGTPSALVQSGENLVAVGGEPAAITRCRLLVLGLQVRLPDHAAARGGKRGNLALAIQGIDLAIADDRHGGDAPLR